jgi:hypothetical protein
LVQHWNVVLIGVGVHIKGLKRDPAWIRWLRD